MLPDAVLVWDWERYETGVPAGFDALHLRPAVRARVGAEPRPAAAVAERVIADAAALTAPVRGRRRRRRPWWRAAYLCGIGVRYATDDQDGAGAAVGRLEDWLLPVLEGWCEQTGTDRQAVTGNDTVKVEGR